MFKKVLAAVLIVPLLVACEEEESGFYFPRSAGDQNANIGQLDLLYPNRAKYHRLEANDGRACFYRSDVTYGGSTTQELDCWGKYLIGDYVDSLNRGDNKIMALGTDHVCTIREDTGRRIGCTGDNAQGQAESPEVKSFHYNDDSPEEWSGLWSMDVEVVASGNEHTCLLDRFGVFCWGQNKEGQTEVPNLESPIWVAAGGNTSCAIDGVNQLHCWGELTTQDIPEQVTNVTKVDVGSDFVCAAQDGDVICWGNTSDWDVFPRDYVDVKHINAGGSHACVIDQTSIIGSLEMHCFGQESDEQPYLSIPDELQSSIESVDARIQTVAAGYGFTCASFKYDGFEYYSLTAHTAVECWGQDDLGQSTAPQFLCVGFHTTASKDDGSSDTANAYCP